MRERMAFGPDLRRARERRGLSLEQIAERTKVSASLYAGLERNDLSRWPSGLFRRAFVRAYADAVGLDPEDVCRRFVELFPEEGSGEGATAQAAAPPAEAAEPPRLTLAVAPPAVRHPGRIWRRAAAAAVDVALALIPAAMVSLLAGAGWFWLVTGALGVTGHLLVFVVHGTTPGGWLLLRPRPVLAVSHDAPGASRRRSEADAGASGARRHVPRHAAPRAVGGRRAQR